MTGFTDADIRRIEQRLFPPDHDAFTPLRYTPNPGPQAEFHAIAAYARGGPWDVLFGGAMGGGKTVGLVMEAIDAAVRYPGLEVWFVRQTYPDLERDVFPHLERLRNCIAIGGRWNGGQRTLSFPGGGKIRFLHARNKTTALAIRGECQLLIVDERTLIDPDVVDTLTLRIRSGYSTIPVIGIRSGCNPGGVGHSSVKTKFIDPSPAGRRELTILDDETGFPLREDPEDPTSRILTRYFLPSLASDNPHLDATYRVRFSMMSADARAAFRDGDWSRFEGMRFADFVMGIHVISPSAMPLDLADLTTGIGIDYGSAAPFAAIWGARVHGGEGLVVYREAHETGLSSRQQGELVAGLQQDPEVGQPAWIDPSTWTRNPEEPLATGTPDRPPSGSIAHRYLEAGVAVRKAHNDRVTGWSAIEELVRLPDVGDVDETVEVEGPEVGEEGPVEVEVVPQRLYVYDTCPNLIRSLTGAPRNPKDPEDVDPAYRDDHALDAFRYLVMGLMGGPARRPARAHGSGTRMAEHRVSTGIR